MCVKGQKQDQQPGEPNSVFPSGQIYKSFTHGKKKKED